MVTDNTVLEQAISLVDQERAHLREERRAYEAFREQVRLATPDSTDTTGPSETTEGLLAAYRDEVMDALDHETVYGHTLADSLEEELSPAIADILLANKPLTQQRKRTLLVRTAVSIESRQQFLEELKDEHDDLASFAANLETIRATIKTLPPCSSQKLHPEKLLDIWEVYDTLERRCEQLLETRQKQYQESERNVRSPSEKHALNEYLYGEMDTQYPVFTAIARTIESIDDKRTPAGRSMSAELSVEI